ncbi:hypothetical protein GCM10027610_134810 [Dactylosporangium cerinum]
MRDRLGAELADGADRVDHGGVVQQHRLVRVAQERPQRVVVGQPVRVGDVGGEESDVAGPVVPALALFWGEVPADRQDPIAARVAHIEEGGTQAAGHPGDHDGTHAVTLFLSDHAPTGSVVPMR